MKRHSKFLTLFLALAMLMAFTLPMTVSAVGENGSITINSPGRLVLDKDDFFAYKLFDVNVTTKGSGSTTSFEFFYIPTAEVKAFLKAVKADTSLDLGDYGVTTDPTGGPAAETAAALEFLAYLQAGPSEDDLIELAKVLIAKVSSLSDSGTASLVDEKNVKISGLDYGYYLVTAQGLYVDPDNANHTEPDREHEDKVISRGILCNVPGVKPGDPDELEDDVTVNLKADAPMIDKEVWNHGTDDPGTSAPGSSTGGAKWDSWTDVNVGDTVYFKHTTSVPDMKGYDSYTFIVHDLMSKGLTFDPSSVVIKIGSTTLSGNVSTPAGTQFTVSPATKQAVADDTEITITFHDFIDWKAQKDAVIEITYAAELNKLAVIGAGAPGNFNEVQLEYSNNPHDTNEKTKTPWHRVRVYTFDLKIFKFTGKMEDGTLGVDYFALPGAEFNLTADGASSPMKFRKLVSGDVGYGTYDYIVDDSGSPTLVSAADGYIRIKGLDAGLYELEETVAPPGGFVAGFKTTIEIKHTLSSGGKGTGNSTLEVEGTPVSPQQVNVENNAGGQLPGTGGIGTYIFYGVGIAMAILLTAAFIIYRRRKTLGALDAA